MIQIYLTWMGIYKNCKREGRYSKKGSLSMNHSISYFYWAAAKWLPWGFASQKNLSLLFKSQGGTFLLLLAQYHKINVRFIDLLGWKVWYAKCTCVWSRFQVLCVSRKHNLLSWKQYIKLLASIPSRYWLNSSIREDQIDLYFISRSVALCEAIFLLLPHRIPMVRVTTTTAESHYSYR